MEAPKSRLIHVARMHRQNRAPSYLFLRQLDPDRYVWFAEEKPGQEVATPIWGANYEEALLAARQAWKEDHFSPLHCGFRYTLPERDEHGVNALFYQMIASYGSMTGIYFEEELGSNCIVHNASVEARDLWKALQQANRL